MSINLSTFWTTWGVSSGDTSSTNQYDFWRGLIMNDATRINSQYDFFKWNNTTRYQFFNNLNSTYPEVWDETTFYQNTNDSRIFDAFTFYTYAAQSLPGGGPPPPPSLTAEISPVSAVTFTNVALDGSTNGSSPTYIWTLSNFKNTSDETITSYTGNPLTEGYFTSSGNSNVTLTVIDGSQTATTSTFNVVSFTPLDISDLKSWHDSTQGITLVGGDVDQWADQSGNDFNLAAPTSSQRPNYSAYTLNNLPLLSAASGGKLIERSTYGLDAQVSGGTVYVLGTQFADMQVYGRLVDAGVNNQFWVARDATNDNMIGGFLNNQDPYGSIVPFTPGDYYTICISGTTSQSNLILNNSSRGTVYTYSDTDYQNVGLAVFMSRNSPYDYTNSRGAVGEIIGYSRTLTSSENTTIVRYLRNKWQHY